MGAAGDMLAAALTELLPDPEAFILEMNSLGLPDVHFTRKQSIKCGITCAHIDVAVNGMEEESQDFHHGHHHHHDHSPGTPHTPSHHHSTLKDLEHIIRDHLSLPDKVKEDIVSVYHLIAEAESQVHGVSIPEIHFHEVGTMDALADITAVCLLMHRLSPDEVIVSPVHVGSGQVRCAHGILPVPAPATAWILRNVPVYGGSIEGELCTPTGAALLKHFASRFGRMPLMEIQAIGYGMGKKDFEAANCVRAFMGGTPGRCDEVLELSCNVDDMTAEETGFAINRLFEGGALDVYTIPIGMKKSRPGTLIRVICSEREKKALIALLFKYTTTIGVREARSNRYVLDRSITTLETPYGTVRRKDSAGYGITRSKYEYDDLSRIAEERNLSIAETVKLIENR